MTLTSPERLQLFPNGNPKPDQPEQAREAHERLKDRAPRELSVKDFASLGHERRPLLAVIRQNCIECQGGNVAEVRRCKASGCPFWPYRMGTNPLRLPILAVSDGHESAARATVRGTAGGFAAQ